MNGSVLLLGNFLSRYGLSRAVGEDIAARLAQNSWNVIGLSDARQSAVRIAEMLMGCVRYRRQYDVAVVEVYSGRAFLWAEWTGKLLTLLGKPWVAALHGGALPQFRERHEHRITALLRLPVAVTAPSAYLQSAFQDVRPDTVVIPNGIDAGRYPYRRRPTVSPNMVWLRAFHDIYEPSTAVRVLAKVIATHKGARLCMVGGDKGDGSLERARKLAAELGVGNAVEFRGPVEKAEVGTLLDKFDIFLNTSRFDNTPVSVIEAMACGLCVVSTNPGGVPHLIENRRNGLLADVSDVESLAANAQAVLENPSLAAFLSESARRTAEQFDWHVVLAKWEEVLNRVREKRTCWKAA